MGKTWAFPEGVEALWGCVGLLCLILGSVLVLALRTRFRGHGDPAGAKGKDAHPLE